MFGCDSILGFGWPGHPELLVVALIALLLFGKRLPEVARGLGRSLTEFKKGLKDTTDDINEVKNDVVNETREASGIDEVDKA